MLDLTGKTRCEAAACRENPPRGRTPFYGERESVSTTDSPINVGNDSIPGNAGIQPVFSALASDVLRKLAVILIGVMPIPRGTNCTASLFCAESPHPAQDPQLPTLPERKNAPTRLSRMPAAIARINRVAEVCQSISYTVRRKHAFAEACITVMVSLPRIIC